MIPIFLVYSQYGCCCLKLQSSVGVSAVKHVTHSSESLFPVFYHISVVIPAGVGGYQQCKDRTMRQHQTCECGDSLPLSVRYAQAQGY